jgi:hypothetical protein
LEPFAECALSSVGILSIKLTEDVVYELEKLLNNLRVLRVKSVKRCRTERMLVNLNLSGKTAKNSGATALNVLASAFLWNNRQIILPRVAALGLPAIYQFPAAAEEGGFIGYGSRLDQIYRNIWARQLIKLLRGAKPVDIPVEQPIKFELVVNLKTAEALGLTIPESFLLRADKVIE